MRVDGLKIGIVSILSVFLLSGFPPNANAQASVETPAWEKLKDTPQAVTARDEEKHEKGRAIFNFYCYYCHGYSGNAKTLAATFLSPKPRDFVNTRFSNLPRKRMMDAVKNGRPGTAMASFKKTLNDERIETVVDFIRREFMLLKARNTWYHTAENGWENHERYSAAFPFATWEIKLDTPDEELTDEQRAGKKLFLESCVSCHDRANVSKDGPVWQKTSGLNKEERMGETLFQENCAFCHAKDGTGRNWIGAFLKPHPRNLVEDPVMKSMTKKKLKHVIKNGLPNSSMPAWKSVLAESEIDAIISYISKVFHPIKEG